VSAALPVGRRARVRVPATSANLGPAFDAAGLALDLHDDVELTVIDEPRSRIEVEGEGAGSIALDESHLVLRTVDQTFRRLGVPPPSLLLRCTNRIPHARGLGSSAAAIVAGVLGARELVPGGVEALPLSRVLDLVAELEGHPDNVAAALLGGLTLAWRGGPAVLGGTAGDGAFVVTGRDTSVLRLTPASTVRPVVLVPPTPSSTHAARGTLPETVAHADAATAAGRGALLAAALTLAPVALLPATHDVLHQPYRAALMPESAALVADLRGRGLAAVVSGAGPSLLVLTVDDDQRQAALDAAPSGWWAVALDVAGPATADLV
jgi:homoserine kinase